MNYQDPNNKNKDKRNNGYYQNLNTNQNNLNTYPNNIWNSTLDNNNSKSDFPFSYYSQNNYLDFQNYNTPNIKDQNYNHLNALNNNYNLNSSLNYRLNSNIYNSNNHNNLSQTYPTNLPINNNSQIDYLPHHSNNHIYQTNSPTYSNGMQNVIDDKFRNKRYYNNNYQKYKKGYQNKTNNFNKNIKNNKVKYFNKEDKNNDFNKCTKNENKSSKNDDNLDKNILEKDDDDDSFQPKHFLIRSNVIIPFNRKKLQDKSIDKIKKDIQIKSINDEDNFKEVDDSKDEDTKNVIFKINREKEIDIIDNSKINTIQDIINIGKLYENKDFSLKNYSFNVEGLYKMIKPLEELDNMIGLLSLKKQIIDQIIYFSQEFHESLNFPIDEKKEDNSEVNQMKLNLENMIKKIILVNNSQSNNLESNNLNQTLELEEANEEKLDMFHTIIQGPPGVGKTQLGKIISKIYLSLGVTKNNKFKIVNRQDLIGEYLGHTAIKTQNIIDSCLGGVLFIDEAYSLGSGDSKKDSYSKECIDTINQNLSEKKGKFICIIAGYEQELERDFFSVNPGLKRRFSFKYTINKYSQEELTLILLHKIKKIGWSLDDESEDWFQKSNFLKDKISQFPNFGGDIETWLLNIKIEHSKRVFGLDYKLHKILNKEDLVNGYERYLEHRNTKIENSMSQMYL